jgi:hypothetical protein
MVSRLTSYQLEHDAQAKGKELRVLVIPTAMLPMVGWPA